MTDHKPLIWLFNCKDPGSRLVRWRLKLEEYDYNIQYKKGKLNCNADALSRIPTNNTVSINPVHENHEIMLPENLDIIPIEEASSSQDQLLSPEGFQIPEMIDLPEILDLPPDFILPEDLDLPEDFNIPTPQSVDSIKNDDTYSKCLKTINSKQITLNTKIQEHNENLLKTKIKHVVIPTFFF